MNKSAPSRVLKIERVFERRTERVTRVEYILSDHIPWLGFVQNLKENRARNESGIAALGMAPKTQCNTVIGL